MKYVLPHFKKSRPVEKKDYARVQEDAEKMITLAEKSHGIHESAYAIAHSQVESDDPLRFFVTRWGDVVVNPEITRHTQVGMFKEEGCMSFPTLGKTTIRRYTKCEVKYYLFDDKGELEEHNDAVKGVEAQIFQHEIDHMDAKYIYNSDEVKDFLKRVVKKV